MQSQILDVAQLVAHLVRDQEVEGSSPFIQTILNFSLTDSLPRNPKSYWYALKVFYKRTGLLNKELQEAGHQTFIPSVPVKKVENGAVRYSNEVAVSSLLFVKCPEKFILGFKLLHEHDFLVYRSLEDGRPGRIPEKEMDNFMKALKINDPDAEFLGSDTTWFKDGQRVRIIEGVHKGREGWIRRIKGRKRFIVCVEGVAAVAYQAIPAEQLEVLEESSRKK